MANTTIKTAKKNFNKAIDTVGKKAGLNVFERRTFKKNVNNFCYDTCVNVATELIVSGVEGTAHLIGQGVAFVTVVSFDGVKKLGNLTAKGAKSATAAIKEKSKKVSVKKSKKAENKKIKKEAVEESAEEIAEAIEDLFEEEIEESEEE